MAKTNFSEVSTGKITIEAQSDGTTAQTSSLGAVSATTVAASGNTTVGGTLGVTGATTLTGALALGTGNAVSAAASVASTHKVAVSINGTTYYLLATNVA